MEKETLALAERVALLLKPVITAAFDSHAARMDQDFRQRMAGLATAYESVRDEFKQTIADIERRMKTSLEEFSANAGLRAEKNATEVSAAFAESLSAVEQRFTDALAAQVRAVGEQFEALNSMDFVRSSQLEKVASEHAAGIVTKAISAAEGLVPSADKFVTPQQLEDATKRLLEKIPDVSGLVGKEYLTEVLAHGEALKSAAESAAQAAQKAAEAAAAPLPAPAPVQLPDLSAFVTTDALMELLNDPTGMHKGVSEQVHRAVSEAEERTAKAFSGCATRRQLDTLEDAVAQIALDAKRAVSVAADAAENSAVRAAEAVEQVLALYATAEDLQGVASSVSGLRERVDRAVEDAQALAEKIGETFEAAVPSIVEQVTKAIPEPKAPEAPDYSGAISREVASQFKSVADELSERTDTQIRERFLALPKPQQGERGIMGVVVPYIGETVYERGALVLHGGGTWQALRPTKAAPEPGSKDWECLAAGVQNVEVKQVSERKFVIAVTLSDGSVSTCSASVPAMVYRGVYDEENDYDEMDVVTEGGSMWVAKSKAVKGDAPGKSASWQLAVKHGKDGRGIKGDKGDKGNDGFIGRTGYAYCGEYEEDKEYQPNSIVEYASSVWLSKRLTKERPPYLTRQSNDDWMILRG